MLLKPFRTPLLERINKLQSAFAADIFHKIEIHPCHFVKQKRIRKLCVRINAVFILFDQSDTQRRIKKRVQRVTRNIAVFFKLFFDFGA